MKTQKELKAEYKQMKTRMGVFQIRNIDNNKIFIGSSTDLKAIWFSQKLQLDAGNHPSAGLQRDWKELGSDHFAYEILEEMEWPEDPQADYRRDLKALQTMCIEAAQPFEERGYNTRPRKYGS